MTSSDADYFPLYKCKTCGKILENPKRPEEEGFERLDKCDESCKGVCCCKKKIDAR